jgi:SAM-dependent methyltransferase
VHSEDGLTPDDGGYDERYVSALAAAEDRHFWFRARNAVIRAAASTIEPTLASHYRVLEVGCGTGNTLRVLAEVFRRGWVVGVDAQYGGLVVARDRLSCPLVQADIRHLPFHQPSRFDVAALFDVIEHIQDDVGALAALRPWLTAGGRVLLTVPAAPELWSAFDVAARHCRRYTVERLQQTLTAAGFQIDYISPFMASLYPVAFVRRRSNARRRQTLARRDPVLEDLRVVPLVNGVLAWILGREAPLIAARHQLRRGTSLIAIARNAV